MEGRRVMTEDLILENVSATKLSLGRQTLGQGISG